VGPGLGGLGPAASYAHLGPLSKLVLSCLMILGRLEIFAVVALFIPSFWRR
jgi:trk system potassium uptake protein TrkH